jgi:tetratricopeptide (TPR) repeat protein
VKREPIMFVVVLLILGLMTYSLLQEKAPRKAKTPNPHALEDFRMGSEDPVLSLGNGTGGRDLFRRPAADEPLEPLPLPDPELANLAVLMPPPMPDSGPSYWSEHLFKLTPTLLGDLNDLVDAGTEQDTASSSEEDLADVFQDEADGYKASYDWVRLDPLTILYGHLVGENRYDYKKGDTLEFKEVNPRTGTERFGLRPFGADEYISFGFADNLHNKIELEVRQQRARMSPSRVGQLRDYVRWLLDQGLAVPNAFVYSEELAMACVNLDENDIENWMLLGEVWERTFDLDRAFALYATLSGDSLPQQVEDFGINVPQGRFDKRSAPRVRMGMILRSLDLDEVAEPQLQTAADLNDGDPAALLELGILYLNSNRVAEGRILLERAMGLQKHRNSNSGLRNSQALGEAALRSGSWAAASTAYAEAERAANNNKSAGLNARRGAIAAAYLAGNFSEASDQATSALQEFGTDATLLYLRGIAEGADGGSAGEVIRDLRAAAAAQPFDAAPALSAMAFWLDRMGERELADVALADALDLSPQHFYSRYLKANWAARDGNSEAAREELQSLVRIEPNCAAVLAEFSTLLYSDGSQIQAEVAFRRLEELFPAGVMTSKSAPAWAGLTLRRGLNLLQMGELEKAMASFDQALSMDTELHAARNAKGMVYYREGDFDATIAEFAYLQDSLRDTEGHPQALYAQVWQARVEEHAKLRLWVDAFEGRRLRAGWDTQEAARLGVEPRLEDGAFWLSGRHSGVGETKAYRTVPGISFRDFTTDLSIGSGHRGEAGAYIALQNRNKETWYFRVYRDRENKVTYEMSRGSRVDPPVVTRFLLREGEGGRVRFNVNREANQPVLTVWFNDEVLYSDQVSNLRNPTGRMACGLFVATSGALDVNASIDNVEMIFAQQ